MIIASSPNSAPDVANNFVQVLTAQTRRLPTQPGMQAGITVEEKPVVDDSESVRTFGMPDNPEDSDNPEGSDDPEDTDDPNQ
jgi:hypothetical protein